VNTKNSTIQCRTKYWFQWYKKVIFHKKSSCILDRDDIIIILIWYCGTNTSSTNIATTYDHISFIKMHKGRLTTYWPGAILLTVVLQLTRFQRMYSVTQFLCVDVLSLDLTTYDTAKHLILKKTSLRDNPVTHSLARCGVHMHYWHQRNTFVLNCQVTG